MWKRLLLAVFILLAIEVGLFLLLFPWTAAWEKNYFLSRVPLLRAVFTSPYFCGAISGLGLVNLWVGLAEAWHFRERVKAMEMREAVEAARLKDVSSVLHH